MATSIGCKESSKQEKTTTLRLNQIQALGSHNSYKQKIEPALLELISQESQELAQSLEYGHLSLTEQLETYKLRNLELDVVHDPEGGRYAQPLGMTLLQQQGIEVMPYDIEKKIAVKGFKTIHIPDIDFRSNCLLFTDCLKEIKNWSDAHPNHLPICITMNAKSDTPDKPGFVELLPFTEPVLNALENEILSVFPKEHIIKPDDVRGEFETLEKAVLASNWPILDEVRGKIMLVLDEGGEKKDAYIKNHPSLRGRLMFIPASPGEPEAAFMIMNYPERDRDTIKALVKKGYMVRTRADEATIEARKGNYNRFIAALNSGAHFISTDYYVADSLFASEYKIELPTKTIARCNPVTTDMHCNAVDLE